MKTTTNILSKIFVFLLLALCLGWGGSAWAQTTQLPLESGVYEILNISNESGSDTGRGYLVSFTQHNSGIGLANCTYSQYRNLHPLVQNDGSTTCSYWYLHRHDDGTYTLVSISTLGGNAEPRFLTVGPNAGKSSIATTPETRLVFKDTNKNTHNRNGKKAVNIANQSAPNVYLSGGCATRSTSGSVMATTTADDGGCPWLFIPVTTPVEQGQQAIIDKYLARFAKLPDGTKLRFEDEGHNPITSKSPLVKYTPVGGGYTVELSSSDATYDFHDVLFSPSSFSSTFDYSLKSVSFDKNTSTLTFVVAYNKWYRMKVANIDSYVSSDYADSNGMRLASGQGSPDNYAGIWRSVDTGGVALNSNGKNVSLYNAKFYDTKLLAMRNPASDGNARGSMYAPNAVPSGAATIYEQRVSPSHTDSYYFRITGNGVNTNTYINQRNPYFSNWTGGGYENNGSQFIIEELPTLGDDVRVIVDAPGGETVLYSTQCDVYSTVFGESATNVVMTSQEHYNFHNMPFLASLFRLQGTHTNKYLSVTFNETTQTLTLTVADNPYIIQYSAEPTADGWNQNTKWYSMRNNRTGQSDYDKSYITTSATAVTDDGQMRPILPTMPNDLGSYWCFVGDNTHGFVIQNAAYGPDYVLGIKGVDRQVNEVRMLHKNNIPSGFDTVFTAVSNTVIDDATNAWAFRIGLTGNSHLHVTNGTFIRYDQAAISGGDTGSAFKLTAVKQDVLDALTQYDVYTVVRRGAPNDFDITYKTASKVFGKRGHAYNGNPLILTKDSPVTPEDFTYNNPEYILESVSVKEQEGHLCKLLVLQMRDERATEEYSIIVEGVTTDNTVIYNSDEYHNEDHIFVRPNRTPEATSFEILGVDGKFVWGPVIDTHAKTVTYDVRDRAETFESGWYQLEVAPGNVDAIKNKILSDEGNINTKANTLYLAPANFEPGSNRNFKFTGVPQYAGEASTFLKITDKGNGTYEFLNPSTGKTYSAGGFTFSNGVLTKSSGWSVETTPYPLEGPYLIQSGNESLSFNVAPVDLEQYDVYQIYIEGVASTSGIQFQVNNNGILGNKAVVDRGYVFVKKDAEAPKRTQFSVTAGNVTVREAVVGQAENGVIPIILHVAARETVWTLNITGAAKSENDRIVYNNIEYVNGATVPILVGTVPSATAFKTNVTDRFVWGPIIDAKAQTVTFDVRTPATNLEAGAWYQLQLSPTATGIYYNSSNQTQNGNLVEGALKYNPRNAGSQIYLTGANKPNSWTVELIGKPENEAETYIYIKSRSGNSTQMVMQNGNYITDQSQSSTNASNTNIEFITTNNQFHWKNYVYPWQGLNGMNMALGKAGSNIGPVKFIAHKAPVKAYKVNLSSSMGTLVYNGETEIIGSKRAEHGRFFFAPDGAKLEGEEDGNIDVSKFYLRGIDGTINSITASTTNGITTLTVNVNTTFNNQIIHKQNRYYDYLETDANKPDDGFIQDGEGWSVRTGKNGVQIREQNTSVYEIPIYLKQGGSINTYLPTDQLASYQRWYNWDTDGQVDRTVLTSNLSGYTEYNNGYAIFRGAQNGNNVANAPTLTLPSTMTEYNVGLDISRFTDYTQGVQNTNNSAIEPSLGMRIVYQVRDAKIIANAIKKASTDDKFYEVHNISLPNVQYGSRAKRLEDRTLSTTLPLDMDLNNYWGFNNGGTGNDNLVPLTQDSQLRIELVDGGSKIQNYMMIPETASDASGKISRVNFNRGHFVLFQYPDNGYIEPNSTATINVYMKSGTVEYKLVQFNLTFIGNAHPLVVTELKGTYRHPDALAEEFGAPVTELTFDEGRNFEYSTSEGGVSYPDYRYPLDYKGSSYSFGARNEGRGWAASRGEYGLQSFAGSSGQTGSPRLAYYPVVNYLNSMSNPSTALGSKVEGAHQLYIDAADQPGKIASIELKDALCAGSRLYCYGYIGCTSGGTGQNPTSVLINVMGIDKTTGEEELIYSYCPGIITLRGYAEDGRTIYSTSLGNSSSYTVRSGSEDRNYWAPWQQIGFSFAIDATTASKMKGYSIQIMNNAYNSNGGDTMLDDFQIYVKKPGAEVANTTPLCSDQIRHVKVITEYNTLLEAVGEDKKKTGLMNVGFCFLDKEVYDKTLEDYEDYDDAHGYKRNDPDNKYNKAFGAALMGNRTLDRTNKDHAFHNFDIIRDGTVSTIDNVTKERFYTDIPQYSFKESSDDVVYRDSIRGERYIVFKESVAHGEASGITEHKWTAGKSYYLLFSTATITEDHVNLHDLGCTVFNLDDNKCAVLYEFTVAPPVSIKGDAETITSGDEVQACEGQTPTLSVNLNGRTETEDVVIKNLNYDWWTGYVSHKRFEMENGVPRDYDSNGHAIILPGEDLPYNTLPATLQNYMNIWWGTYKKDNKHLDKKAGERIFLHDALLEFRRAYPDATSLDGVEPVHKVGDTEEYELTQDMIDCIAHFLVKEPESGMTPLVLSKKEMNIALNSAKADENNVVHFVVIPIAPGLYSVDEDVIYCPDPQELKIQLQSKSPTLANGFNDMPYPEAMDNVPVRIGLRQIETVRQVLTGTQPTLTVPLRKANFALEVGKRLIKSIDNTLYLVSTDDPAFKTRDDVSNAITGGKFDPSEDDIEAMFINAGTIQNISVERNGADPKMHVFFNNTKFREGYTYTFKVKFYELKEDNERDMACEGSFVFDMKVVPEYQKWTGAVNNDWTNDNNWARADRTDLNADNAKSGSLIEGSTDFTSATAYHTNEANDTGKSFVPMYFTNVLIDKTKKVPVLYDGLTEASHTNKNFLEGLEETATPEIVYDLEVIPTPAQTVGHHECTLFGTYVAKGITFKPSSQLINAHLLNYQKAWVEYDLDTNRWYTLASPLQNTYSGDWYSPTDGGRQLTPHFHSITYQKTLNDRFSPAYYQRSWDKAESNVFQCALENNIFSTNPFNVAVKLDWSRVYNDVNVDYSNGGFSVKPVFSGGADGTVLVRMPKADTSYSYYHAGNTHEGFNTAITRTEGHYHLNSDLLANAEYFEQSVKNDNESEYYLVANPFMATMDMDKFFAENTQFMPGKYWIVADDKQYVSIKSDDQWLNTSEDGNGVVAPLQSFFVKRTSTTSDAIQVRYTKAMQADATVAIPVLKSRSRRDSDEPSVFTISNGTSDALCYFTENGDAAYREDEDAELLLDSNLSDHVSTVFSVASGQALHVNVLPNDVTTIPLGVIAHDEDAETTLTLTGTAYLAAAMSEAPYLYDAETGTHEPIDEGTEVYVKGTSAGRYFIVSGLHLPYETAVEPDGYEDADGAAYDIRGIRVSTPQRGTITIQRDGRKVYNR